MALEITESTLVEDFAATEHIMAALGRFGVRFAIDDFGTGFSSLGYLTRLPFHVLEIDRSVVASICDDTRQRSIVRALVEMAGALELYVIAEGVETEAQEAEVRRLGCHAAQGFRYSPPLPADRVATWLA
ncbi:MAG: EAL domain-containing protein [Halofilum sp. (in: g-proteobacteria)]|nr:EAL domain-containing protein [Halofilum sp. (in: g-proteobacteria)]